MEMAILSQPSGLKTGPSPGTLIPVKGQGPLFPAGNTPGFTSKVMPQPCCLPLPCPAAQPQLGHRQTHSTSPAMALFAQLSWASDVSNPVTPRKAAHGQKQSQSQAGPQPTLPACNKFDTQSQEPSVDGTSELQSHQP